MVIRRSETEKSGLWISYDDFTKSLMSKGSDKEVSKKATRREVGGIDKWSEPQRSDFNKKVHE